MLFCALGDYLALPLLTCSCASMLHVRVTTMLLRRHERGMVSMRGRERALACVVSMLFRVLSVCDAVHVHGRANAQVRD